MSDQPKNTTSKSFPVLILTTLLNTIGIGIIIPVLPFLVDKYTGGDAGQTVFYTGLIISLYALCEFLIAPTLGAISDKFGRRPVLIFSLIGSAIGYLLLGFGGSLAILILGRIIDGLTAGNISTIFAYVADITEPKDRGKNYGIIGGALGVGFMVGPSIGGFAANYGLNVPMFLAAGVTIINLIWVIISLPESIKEHKKPSLTLKNLSPFTTFQKISSNSALKAVLLASFFFFVAFAELQGNGSILFKDALNWNPGNIGLIFLLIGAIDIVAQGFLTEKLITKFVESNLIKSGLFICGLGFLSFALIPVTKMAVFAIIGAILFSSGSGLFEPSMASTVSKTSTGAYQGLVQGSYQSLQSLTRVIGPLLATFLYGFGASNPYILAVCLCLLSVILFVRIKQVAN
jgi:DHA1 family tetracycline resistance protein-like MFS transporter